AAVSNGRRAALARPAAIVTSATVDVQVLRIGAKQMTLAVFRQLLRDDDIDGPKWGTVNYHHRLFPFPCKGYPDDEHAHLVWHKGNDLIHAALLLVDGYVSEHLRHAKQILGFVMKDHGYQYLAGDEASAILDLLLSLSSEELIRLDMDRPWQNRSRAWIDRA